MSEVTGGALAAAAIPILDRIIPADDFPSASGADVHVYIERQLGGDLRHLRPLFVEGLAEIDAEAVARHGSPFASLDAEGQDALLRHIESGRDAPARRFFLRIIDLAHEGYYADPANGGNRDGVSWTMIGFDLRGQR
jgi:hypothetical protein